MFFLWNIKVIFKKNVNKTKNGVENRKKPYFFKVSKLKVKIFML